MRRLIVAAALCKSLQLLAMNIQHMLPQFFSLEKVKNLSMFLISLNVMYYSHAWVYGSQVFGGVGCCFVCFTEFPGFKAFISLRGKSPDWEAKG